jgi:hypothetical protein
MAANVIFCNDGVTTENVDFSGQSIPLGSFITGVEEFLSDPLDNINYCLEITSTGQTGPFILTATTSAFTSCYDCLVQNNTIVEFVDCATNSVGLQIELSQLGYLPIEGAVFNMTVTGGRNSGTTSGCFYITDIVQYSTNAFNGLVDLSTIDQIIHSNFSLENGCNECLNGFSAGTESTICVVCCPCTTGETVTSVSAPHPTWTNGQGQAVIQLNAITLGGPNGLNN